MSRLNLNNPSEYPEGFAHYPLYFTPAQQAALIGAVKAGVDTAPFYQPTMPRTGNPLSVVMSNFGPLGWVTDKEGGYRYVSLHPKTGAPWPALPDMLQSLWDDVSGCAAPPEACLINWYREGSKMGLHVDNDERDTRAPVVSVSLGDPAIFRLGGTKRGGPTQCIKLFSGDVVVLGGEARSCYHGVSKVDYGQSALVPKGGRINLTMRRVNPAAH
ncbi:alpha-ketoglutarate-dependent dioxygenase AlkB family protein [Robiginitomaculum antarcticum]|uniref:alpha-ketoglutarate-dependent dioxygenase AlkB family protein n=1 Tax=Robiginitomaculum antarcticum TaxID=437507 RepID=UPI00039E763A|nr:alpha-ketoglutarate-dependent dioxygenase AlkB [Robiginitomaculum antarcticum]